MKGELQSIDKQIILYCKGWFRRNDILDDLKVIIGKWAGIEPMRVSARDVYEMLVEIVIKCFPKNLLKCFFSDLYKYKSSYDLKEMIMALCGKIAIIQVRDGDKIFIDLGKPDYSLLPPA